MWLLDCMRQEFDLQMRMCPFITSLIIYDHQIVNHNVRKLLANRKNL